MQHIRVFFFFKHETEFCIRKLENTVDESCKLIAHLIRHALKIMNKNQDISKIENIKMKKGAPKLKGNFLEENLRSEETVPLLVSDSTKCESKSALEIFWAVFQDFKL